MTDTEAAIRADERAKCAAELHRITGLHQVVGGLSGQAYERLEALADTWRTAAAVRT